MYQYSEMEVHFTMNYEYLVHDINDILIIYECNRKCLYVCMSVCLYVCMSVCLYLRRKMWGHKGNTSFK